MDKNFSLKFDNNIVISFIIFPTTVYKLKIGIEFIILIKRFVSNCKFHNERIKYFVIFNSIIYDFGSSNDILLHLFLYWMITVI